MKNKKNYWNLNEEERRKADKIEAERTKPKTNFYLWYYCKIYGWRQLGKMNGYDTLKELKADREYQFNLKEGFIQQIMKSEIVEEN